MGYTLFMSDMHLCPSRPRINQLFISYLEQHGAQADAVYLLGDLFEVWLGDAVSLPDYPEVISCLKRLSQQTRLYVQRGNRDFMLAQGFADASGAELLSDPSCISLYGKKTLISHGDLLCTDDVNYQRYRRIVSNKAVQWLALHLIPDAKKRDIAKKMRATSKKAQSGKQSQIMDVNQDAVRQWFSDYGVAQMIHGHTHRPDSHEYEINGSAVQRWVLGDWYEQGSVLTASNDGQLQLESLALK